MLKRSLPALVIGCLLALAGCGTTTHTTTAPERLQRTSGQSAMGSVAPPGWGQTPKGNYLLPPPMTGVATRELFDTTTATAPPVPFKYPLLAGYTAGFWPTYLPLTKLPWHPRVISIAISAAFHAQCLDIEPGDAVPSQAGQWAKDDIKAGYKHPCEYGDLSEMPAIKASLAATFGAHWHAHVFLWLAWYRYIGGLVAGYDAVQWNNTALGLNLDESTATLAFLGIAPKPVTYQTDYKAMWSAERYWVIRYDGARQHPAKYAGYLKHTLEPKLAALALAVYQAAHRHKPPNWSHVVTGHGTLTRGQREQILFQRSRGHRFV